MSRPQDLAEFTLKAVVVGVVLGVVFGAAVDDDDTGFVLTANEVSRQLAQVNNTEPVPTGSCLPA